MKGIHLHGPERDHDKLMSMGFTHYLGCQDTLPWLIKIKAEQADAHIIIRFYDPDRMDKSGQDRAWDDFDWFLDHPEAQRICDGIIPDNELNLDCEHGNESYGWSSQVAADAILHWKVSYLSEFRRLCGGISWYPKIHFGAYSPAPGKYHAYQYQTWALSPFDMIDYHHYGTMAFIRTYGACSVPYMITEYNQGDEEGHGDFIGMLNQNETVFWFLWSTQDPNHKKYQMCEWPENELQRVRDWRPNMSLYAEWCRALSPGEEPTRERFCAFLREIGKPNPDDAEAYGFPVSGSGDYTALAERVARIEAALLGIGDALNPFRS
jgi:hypothetical protein